MPLAAGETLGFYEILSPLGAGGMGEVYKARDTRLDRTVAVKVLATHLAGDPRLKERFEREARAVSSLNHPHICTLHDVGQHDGVDFLVLEYLAGESLADRLKKGALPFEDALRFGSQVADALEKAHRQGVVHRDLKPGNVMLTETGVKLLDFGLAKLARPEAGPVESAFPTEQQRSLTAEGSILGTFQYMAPEQLEGQEADARTDIFAFGAMLHEMVTGRRAFEGKSQASLIGAIMTSDPPAVSQVQALAPRQLDQLVQVCLAKRPDDRWQSAGDVARQLKWLGSEGHSATAEPQAVTTAGRRHEPLWGAAGLLVGALVATLAFSSFTSAPEPAAVTRFSITLPPSQVLSRPGRRMVSMSPDGRQIAYTANGQIYLREMNQVEAAPIRGTDINPATPFFSPDGEWVGFWAEGALRKVSIRGGSPVPLCETGNATGASWGPDDFIVFAMRSVGILRVSAGGGPCEVVVPMDDQRGEASDPEILPDGETLLFSIRTGGNWDEAAIVAQALETGARRVLLEGGAAARYVPTGHLVYAVAESLFAVPFDIDRLEVAGSPVPVLEGVLRSIADTGAAQFSYSESGSLVFLNPDVEEQPVWVDRDGEEQALRAPATGRYPRLSPDGARLATVVDGDIWIYDRGRGTSSRLTFTGDNNYPGWTSDGRVVFSSIRGGSDALYWKSVDGTDAATSVAMGELRRHLDSVSSHAPLLALHEHHPTRGLDIWVASLDDEPQAQPFLQTPFNERDAVFSPDGRWLAYNSDETGRFEIYVQPFPDPGRKWPISTNGGTVPLWGHDGRELFYVAGETMMSVDVATEPSFRAGSPRALFELGGSHLDVGFRPYDVTADGQLFIISRQRQNVRLNVVLNWHEELKRLVPAPR